ncbi:nitroreductase/quinone reductase family protein [Cellulomonas palmilytica]|uniref:nitroreductase/quinone reductase family protein n=1 Tax=Cellulomonas palmilytica TaxID=2608402 RepID=UPI001F1B92D5|nr:nitroreductase/quinone reductase family protein [Cellulomonas palmilytica]UJP40648.1 nitroreductase family deazaflavin-dependent oxidoreductase [Cellulomonas palmilytica]
MPDERAPWLPPHAVVRSVWAVHRALLRATRGRVGLWRARPDRWGTLRLTTTGRRTGEPRDVILSYLEDGGDLVVLETNGWAAGEPAWLLNLRAHPDATVTLPGRSLAVRAHEATGPERERLRARWSQVEWRVDGFEARRGVPSAVVVLAPR